MNYKPSTIVTVANKTQSLDKFAAELSTPVQTILSRLNRGWDVERACTEPITRSANNKGKRYDSDVLEPAEVKSLLSSARQSETAVRDQALLVVAYRSGLRCKEILALLPKDLDVTRGSLTVHHGKGNKARTVALDATGWAYLAEWMQLRQTWDVNSASPVFCTKKGTPMATVYVARWPAKCRQKVCPWPTSAAPLATTTSRPRTRISNGSTRTAY